LLVDTHCHLNLDHFTGDLDEVISRSLDAGIEKIIIPGVDLATSRKAIEISQKYQSCFAAVGIHPNYASASDPIDIPEIGALAIEHKVVGIGEIGLDLYRDFAPLPSQIELLKMQLDIASELSLPVIIHSRSATVELKPILSDWQISLLEKNNSLADAPGVMHAFEGSLEEARFFQKIGFVFGIGGAWTYTPSRVDENLLIGLPLTSFVFETDSPYLTPVPWRGKRNEPSYLNQTVKTISGKTGVEYIELCKISTATSNKIFKLESF
jgi:TatD DNase family protein